MSTTPALPPERADGDGIYLEKTLRHITTDLLLDDSVSSDVLRDVWRRSFRLFFATFFVFFGIWLFTGGLGSSFSSSSSSGDDTGPLVAIGFLLAIIAFIGSWIAFLSSEKQEAISEWCTLLAGRSAAADSVYSHIVGILRDRALPIQPVPRRTPTGYGATGNRLVLADGYHYVYISVFSYGTSLYLGWNMWRIRKGSVLMHQYYGVQRRGGIDPIGRILNLERLKAMREAVHAACREALHTAVQNIEVPENYGFPNGMPPIEGLPFGTAPQPGFAPQPGGAQWQATPPTRP